MTTNMHDPQRKDSDAGENETRIDPMSEEDRQPRQEQVNPDEPLDSPEEAADDMSRVQGDPAEDDM